MKIVREYKLSNGEIIKEYKVKHEWSNICTRCIVYDEKGKFIRHIKKKDVDAYIDYVETLEEYKKFKNWKGKNNE